MIVALFLALQDPVYISKIDKLKYVEAIESYRQAEKQLESDEIASIGEFTRLIESREIKQKECFLRIQKGDQYDAPFLFVPYQCRGRARLSLAKKATAAGEKKALVEASIADFEESLKRNVKGSAPYLDAAQAELKKLSNLAPPPDPPPPSENRLAQLRLERASLASERKFGAAKALVARVAATLPERDVADLNGLTDVECRRYLTEELGRFRKRLGEIASVAELQALTQDEFEILAALPPASEISIPHPLYNWACRYADTLREAWSRKPSPAALLRGASEVSRIEEGAENPWFRVSEGLAFQEIKSEIAARVAVCADAPRAKREALEEDLKAKYGIWKEFLDHLEPGFRQRNVFLGDHSRALGALLEKQPRDVAEIESEDLHSCFEQFPIVPQLAAFEERLRKLWEQEGITLESRQKLGTLVVAARAFRLFLAGRTEEEVALSVREELKRLTPLGGPFEPDRFGPRIRKVFDSLR